MFHFNQIFHENYTSVKILSRGSFVSIFIKERHGGACKPQQPFDAATSHFSWKLCFSQNFIEGYLHLSVHQGIT
jgi:hypothetical protein